MRRALGRGPAGGLPAGPGPAGDRRTVAERAAPGRVDLEHDDDQAAAVDRSRRRLGHGPAGRDVDDQAAEVDS